MVFQNRNDGCQTELLLVTEKSGFYTKLNSLNGNKNIPAGTIADKEDC
jgi:hypothetical protein